MSESDTSSVTNGSESTIESLEFEKVLKNLEFAVNDIEESKDYLSYSTLLDIYLSDPYRYSYDEREQLLEKVLSILSDNKELTYEIGWDLPGLLILYIDLNYQFEGSIRQAPCVYKVLKLFECLALNGNPKELFLKSCELLNDLHVSDNNTSDKDEFKVKFFDIKVYCIFELIDSCIKRIKTFYPSRFLSMTITSYLNLAEKNKDIYGNWQFLLKRAYIFTRSYSSPSLPEESDELSKEELNKIKSDEEYLQRKLLTGFLTEIVNLLGAVGRSDYSMDILSYIQLNNKACTKKVINYRAESPLLDRCTELALSFDIDLSKVFKEFIMDSQKILNSFDYAADKDDLSSEIFEKIVIDYQENVSNFIVDKEAKKINNSVNGCLILYTHYVSSKRLYEKVEITLSDAIAFTLRSMIPMLVHPSFKSVSVIDLCVYWSWFAMHKLSIEGKKLELEVTKIPSTLLYIYYQVLLDICTVLPSSSNFRYGVLTLLIRILSISPEEISFTFIKDSLANCPYDNVKVVLIGVLKELLTKERKPSLSEEMENLSIKESNKTTPILPTREKSAPSNKFLALNKEKADVILDLIDSTTELTFVENEDGEDESIIRIDFSSFSTLSAYLNLLVIIKDDPILKADNSRIERVLKDINDKISEIKSTTKVDSEAKKVEVNALDMLTITLDRIKEKKDNN